MGVSGLSNALLGSGIERYSRMLNKEKCKMLEDYSNPHIRTQLGNIENRFITLAPIALCDSMLKDLGIRAPDSLLIGLGLSVLHISTYDDIIDTAPKDREIQAALLYAGNIALLEGIKMLVNSGHERVLDTMSGYIEQNSFMQQKVVEILWKEKRPTRKQYERGIRHIISFTCIGPMTALSFSGRMDLENSIIGFCTNYGIALQYLDDMSEIEEDTINGYWSLPRIIAEEKGLKGYLHSMKSKNELIKELKTSACNRLKKADKYILPEWHSMRDKLQRMENTISAFQY